MHLVVWGTQGCLTLSSLWGRFQEKGNLEVLLFTIQSRMRANNQRVYTPHEGRLVSDINRVWALSAVVAGGRLLWSGQVHLLGETEFLS